MSDFIDAIVLAFFINAPIQLIITIGQWLLMGRFLAPEDKTIIDALNCLALSYISAFLLSLFIWFFWPFDPELVMYNNRISIPAILGEMIAIPIWLKWFGYIGDKKPTVQ
ncbi:MAG: hypothetical protein KZQ64_11970 [gamma proteobacterium symbiont of Bathyaustriella thionipta]|nr:hypothetical protein [gamma proteobacterium symbiont of Bathyaustriella thionipta]MCU7949840.1 hypothetical protein [gamma proteobacterium symbiont of Bathyaustriella thionipta]MCU7954088.1 hypothetical protein [gamma proteobacterium symbiont of Bathyaustriella thionipta]MCU7956414.1 hypothetical protein [gamma proteobacterium symbiont of Bathyaustriella thionipta]MCU7966705.1 hypothetical protein [gamma proteobacterium symbiont of Bathyaustriella thionipta]